MEIGIDLVNKNTLEEKKIKHAYFTFISIIYAEEMILSHLILIMV